MSKSKLIILAVLAIVAGFALRTWFMTLAPAKPVFDQPEYIHYGDRLRVGIWAVNCCSRTYAYPLFYAAVTKVFGVMNFFAVRMIQVFMDTATGVLLALIAHRVWKDKVTSILTLWIYELNPFTASFVGFILTEVQAFFLLALLTLFALYLNGGRGKNLVLWAVWGLLVGMFVYTRIAFFWWGLAVMLLVPVIYFGRKFRTFLTVLAAYIGFMIASIYPVAGNMAVYHKFTPLPAFDIITISMYSSTQIKRWPTLVDDVDKEIPPEIFSINTEFYQSINTPGAYVQMERKYRKLLLETIRKDPKTYIYQRLRNMAGMWSKTNIFYYYDPFHPQDALPIQILNIGILSTAFIGLIAALKNRTKKLTILWTMTALIVAFLTIPLAVVAPEERISLPAYPLLMVFSMTGITMCLQRIVYSSRRNKSNHD